MIRTIPVTPCHVRLSALSTRAELRMFGDMTTYMSFRKTDVRLAPGEVTVLVRRPAYVRVLQFLGLQLSMSGWVRPTVPSKLTIRSVCSWRIHDEHPGDEIEVGCFSLYRVGKGLLHMGERHDVGGRYGIEMDIDSLDVELEDIAPGDTPAS